MRKRSRNEKFTERAFPYQGAGGSLRDRVSHGEGGKALALPFFSQLFTGETNKEPLFYLSYLEGAIYDLAEGGYIKALRLALREYRALYLEIAKGDLCKR